MISFCFHTFLCSLNHLFLMHIFPSLVYIRECGSTLYVGLQHVVPPTNTKLKPLLLPTQVTQTLTSTEHHISSLRSHFWVQLSTVSPFLPTNKYRKFIIIIIFNFSHQFRRDFSALRVQILIKLVSIGSYFPAYGTLIKSFEIFRLIFCKTI